MKEAQAAAALKSLAKSEAQLGALCKWLDAQHGITGRYLTEDLEEAAQRYVPLPGQKNEEQLSALVTELADRPDSALVVFFEPGRVTATYEVTGASLGPAADLAQKFPLVFPEEVWRDKADELAVVVKHPAQGRLGAVRAAAWLQTVLGAVGLAAYSVSAATVPLAECPAIKSAVFVEGPGAPGVALHTATRVAGSARVGDLARVFGDGDACQLLRDATARAPQDLAQTRLTLAARWLQVASSAVSPPDALIALGIALETLTGDENPVGVTDRITRRAATFLAIAADESEREDVYFEELERARTLYDWRSRVAHGQYDDSSADESQAEAARADFHLFVLDVCLRFRKHSRARDMKEVADLKNWWARVDLEGVAAA